MSYYTHRNVLIFSYSKRCIVSVASFILVALGWFYFVQKPGFFQQGKAFHGFEYLLIRIIVSNTFDMQFSYIPPLFNVLKLGIFEFPGLIKFGYDFFVAWVFQEREVFNFHGSPFQGVRNENLNPHNIMV